MVASRPKRPPESPVLTLPLDRAHKALGAQITRGRALSLVLSSAIEPDVRTVLPKVQEWHAYNRSWLLKHLGAELVAEYEPPRRGRGVKLTPTPRMRGGALKTADLFGLVDDRVKRLASIQRRLPLWASEGPQRSGPAPTLAVFGRQARDDVRRSTIFVVHDHHHPVLSETVRAVERCTDHAVVVLTEQANQGQTVIEKFERHADEADYAVYLVTADDIGPAPDGTGGARVRQNVIFELGYIMGKLGRDRVAVLLDEGVEHLSDVQGLRSINRDGEGAWGQRLGRELAAAGIEFDPSRMA